MSLEQTIDNLQIRNANMVTFVGTSNTMVDTTTGRIQTKGIQHNSNVITDVSGPHGRVAPSLKKYPEIIFEEGKFDSNPTTNTYTQAGYRVSVSGFVNTSNHPWKAFNGIDYEVGMLLSGLNYDTNGNANTSGTTASRLSASDSTPYGEWLKLELPNKIKLDRYVFTSRNHATHWAQSVEAGQVWGSNNDSNWVHLHTFTNSGFTGESQSASFNVQTDNYYKYYAFIVTKTFAAGTDSYLCIPELEYYGYEEYTPAGDHSVDTTFMSRFNNPQLTGVQVLVDGATGVGTNQISGGPDPSGNQSTYVTDGKYWTLNGTLTSNLAVEANTFLEGDQPHSVSVWFNSSNLEANVSNTCVFSIASEEKLDSVNLDLQSNTWHNLTYAYQGEGGSKVTYVDGRKVEEAQAEDTFGDYPPFAMTGYSQGGYVVSSAGGTDAWEAFNDTTTTNTDTYFGLLDATTPYYLTSTGNFNTTGYPNLKLSASSGTPAGDWIAIEMPYKLKLDTLYLKTRSLSSGNSATQKEEGPKGEAPRDFEIWGTNDSINWYLIKAIIDAEAPNTKSNHGEDCADPRLFVINASKSYKKFAMIVTRNGSTYSGATATSFITVGEMRFYGHRENDLVRLPDPTNVLKYPHIAMTGPAQRGYVFTGSSQHSSTGQIYSMGIDNGYLFDGDSTTVWHIETNGTDNHRYDGTDYSYGTDSVTNFDPTGINIPGEWVQLKFPHKLQISKVHIRARSGYEDQAPEDFTFYGSDTAASGSWSLIQSFTGQSPQDDGTSYYDITTNPVHYKYILMLITRVVGTTALSIAELQYYGTGVDSVPIQIGGGNIDKVANFRVYDKFIDENQALEIWDAQKDEFGRAKSSMTLQKGRLGLGTMEPEGRLAVADEPHNLEEFPPRAMSGYKTYFEGHGEFCASASSEFSGTYRAWDAFNHTGTSDSTDAWLAPMNRYTLNNYIDVDPSVAANINGVYGEWLELKLPYKITLERFTIKSRAGSPYGQPGGPAAGNVWGSNDGVNWTLLTSFTGLTYGGVATTIGVQENVVVNSIIPYSYFRLQPTKRVGVSGSDGWVGVGELRYFGIREQGQSVLHDGQLTLTKSLNVPRIGPPPDADDTPRRDRLVVEYNTHNNPLEDGVVRDTSGRGLDGAFYGGASYDATEKALVFDGTDDNLKNTLNNSEMRTLSISGWIKNADSNTLLELDGGAATSKHVKINMVSGSAPGTGIFIALADGTYLFANNSLTPNTWNHFVFVLNDGPAGSALSSINHQLYINGVIEFGRGGNAFNAGATANDTTVIDPNATLCIGSTEAGSGYHDGSISNFKLYDCALTAEEVKTLYDMGRNGSVANPQPLHIAAPLYSPGSIVQVQYASTPFNNTVRQTITGGELSDAANDIDYLEMNFKPKFANSSILLTAMISVGYGHVASFGFKEDGTVVRTQADNSNATGAIATVYEGSTSNYLEHINIRVLLPANGTHTRRYNTVANAHWADVDYTLYINDRGSNGMRSISNMIVYEIAN